MSVCLGKRDRIVAWKACKPAVDAIPGAQVQMFDAGHAAFLEDADSFNRAFIAFARQLSCEP
jgi:pimeloyl-ACP methyl ester carboxylesterase